MNDSKSTNNSSEIKAQLRVDYSENFLAYTDRFYILNATPQNAVEKMLIDDYRHFSDLHDKKLKLLWDMSYNDSFDKNDEESKKQSKELSNQIDDILEKQQIIERYLKPIIDREKIKHQQEHKRETKLSKTKKWLRRNFITIIVCSVLLAVIITFVVQNKLKSNNNTTSVTNEVADVTPATTIKVIKSPGPVRAGKNATIKIQGIPFTEYSIAVKYTSGYSKASGLYNKTSNKGGEVVWSWKVGTQTLPGTYNITISGGGETITTEFTVR